MSDHEGINFISYWKMPYPIQWIVYLYAYLSIHIHIFVYLFIHTIVYLYINLYIYSFTCCFMKQIIISINKLKTLKSSYSVSSIKHNVQKKFLLKKYWLFDQLVPALLL